MTESDPGPLRMIMHFEGFPGNEPDMGILIEEDPDLEPRFGCWSIRFDGSEPEGFSRVFPNVRYDSFEECRDWTWSVIQEGQRIIRSRSQ